MPLKCKKSSIFRKKKYPPCSRVPATCHYTTGYRRRVEIFSGVQYSISISIGTEVYIHVAPSSLLRFHRYKICIAPLVALYSLHVPKPLNINSFSCQKPDANVSSSSSSSSDTSANSVVEYCNTNIALRVLVMC